MRNFGSVLGVAVLGSLAATFYSRGLPAQAALAAHHPLPAAAADAFVRGVSLGAFGAAGLTIAVAATTAWPLPGKLIHTLFQEESLRRPSSHEPVSAEVRHLVVDDPPAVGVLADDDAEVHGEGGPVA